MGKIQLILGVVALLIHLLSRGGVAVILLAIIIGALLVPMVAA